MVAEVSRRDLQKAYNGGACPQVPAKESQQGNGKAEMEGNKNYYKIERQRRSQEFPAEVQSTLSKRNRWKVGQNQEGYNIHEAATATRPRDRTPIWSRINYGE